MAVGSDGGHHPLRTHELAVLPFPGFLLAAGIRVGAIPMALAVLVLALIGVAVLGVEDAFAVASVIFEHADVLVAAFLEVCSLTMLIPIFPLAVVPVTILVNVDAIPIALPVFVVPAAQSQLLVNSYHFSMPLVSKHKL